jgi:hypothetical protein
MATHTITCNPDGSFSPSGLKVKKGDVIHFKSASGCRVSITPATPSFFSPAPATNPFPVPAGNVGVSLTVSDAVATDQDYSILVIGAPSEGGSGTIRVNT